MVRYIVLLMALMATSCVTEPEVRIIHYSDVQGTWALEHVTIQAQDGNGTVYNRYKEFWCFEPCSARGYVEEWFFNNEGIAYEYQYTSKWIGRILSVESGHENSDAYGKEVVNLQWNMVSDGEKVFSNGAIMNVCLIDLSDNGDTLTVGFCVSQNCYVDHLSPSSNCFDSYGKLIRTDISELKGVWRYY